MNINTVDPTWEQIVSDSPGTIYKDIYDEGLRFIIMRGGSSLCAYIGIPEGHPIAGFGYDDLPIDCHYGLTFSAKGGKNADGIECWPTGYWWYGWDYAHSGDYCAYYDTSPLLMSSFRANEKKWLVKDVEEDSFNAIYDFKKLMRIAEKISNRQHPQQS